MKKLFWALLIFVLATNPYYARQRATAASDSRADAVRIPFTVGERLTYEVSWADFIVAGELILETRDRRMYDDVDGFHLVASAQSVGLVRSIVYKVDDVYESFVNASNAEPFRATKQTRHGNKREQESVEIDQQARTARLADGRTVKLHGQTYDLAGLLFALRTMDLKSARPRPLTLIDEGKLYDLEVTVDGREKITTRAGSFNAVRLATRAVGRGQTDPYKLRVFISDDGRRLPVLLTAEPRWGGVRVELTSIGGSRQDLERPRKTS